MIDSAATPPADDERLEDLKKRAAKLKANQAAREASARKEAYESNLLSWQNAAEKHREALEKVAKLSQEEAKKNLE